MRSGRTCDRPSLKSRSHNRNAKLAQTDEANPLFTLSQLKRIAGLDGAFNLRIA
jgi:hypothetical protein